MGQELGLDVVRASVALPDFAYRAEMPDGTVEHELCPVVIAEVAGAATPDPDEVDDLLWLPWTDVVERVEREPSSLSPWSVEQVRQLDDLGLDPHAWLAGRDAELAEPLLDRPLGTTASTPVGTASNGGGGALAVVHGPLRTTLDRFLADKTAETVALDPVLGEMTGEIRSLVAAGGKRLRPAFVYWGHRATGAAHDEAVLRPAAAIELLHTFALLHDDVMDRSATRRGRASAHTALAAAHVRQQRIGDPRLVRVQRGRSSLAISPSCGPTSCSTAHRCPSMPSPGRGRSSPSSAGR